jgi:hypothetical protein
LPTGSDPTLIQFDDNGTLTYRMYYVDAPGGTQEVYTAISPDGLSRTQESGTGIKNEFGNRAWGVPDSVALPDGRIRIYWVDMPPEGSENEFEVIKSAI